MIQRHTRCSTSYCLRKKGNEKEPKCRFNFSFQHNEKTSLQFELIHSKDNTPKYKIQVVTKRNDSSLNSHQRLQLQGWGANCDIQLVVDYQACVEYLAKLQQRVKQDLTSLRTHSVLLFTTVTQLLMPQQ